MTELLPTTLQSSEYFSPNFYLCPQCLQHTSMPLDSHKIFFLSSLCQQLPLSYYPSHQHFLKGVANFCCLYFLTRYCLCNLFHCFWTKHWRNHFCRELPLGPSLVKSDGHLADFALLALWAAFKLVDHALFLEAYFILSVTRNILPNSLASFFQAHVLACHLLLDS